MMGVTFPSSELLGHLQSSLRDAAELALQLLEQHELGVQFLAATSGGSLG
jgi:hypothetical protein